MKYRVQNLKRGAWKFNDRRKKKWLQVYQRRGTISSACYAVDITRQTYLNAMIKDPKFAASKNEIDNTIHDSVEKSLVERARGMKITEKRIKTEKGVETERLVTVKEIPPDVGACVMHLTNRRPEDWKNTQKVDHTLTEKKVILSYEPFNNEHKGKCDESISKDSKKQ